MPQGQRQSDASGSGVPLPRADSLRALPLHSQCPPRNRLAALLFLGCGISGTTGLYGLIVFLADACLDHTYTNQATIWVFFAHVVAGLAMAVPFVVVALRGLRDTLCRRNRLAIGGSIAFTTFGSASLFCGVLLVQLDSLPRLATDGLGRGLAYAIHVLSPLAAGIGYLMAHGGDPPIRWRWARTWGVLTGAFLLAIATWHAGRPQPWNEAGPADGANLFEPSSTRTVDGNYIPAAALAIDESCRECHADAYRDWFHSAHRFSSFNNPIYRFSVRETREVGLRRDGDTHASRWCAGCHDPVPFLSGAFDDPEYDDVGDSTAHLGIGCAVCHSITHVNSTAGNGAYTIEAPQPYPFAGASNAFGRWLNRQLIKAQPDFHKKSMLKPLHRTSEFCSTCHKVSLPMALNHYKDFLRGQNHYDSHLLSGASGHGVRGFYYPPVAKSQCNDCHMPTKSSDDFGSRDFDGTGTRKIHDHLTPGANTALPYLASLREEASSGANGFQAAIERHRQFLGGSESVGTDRPLRIDIFGIKEGGTTDGKLAAPLRPDVPALARGKTYLVEVVIRALHVGHAFTQGTTDSNEVWVEFSASCGGRSIGLSGGLDGPGDSGQVDRWAHFVNTLVLDRHGNRINRHNPQDIYATVYDHQIPPGAAQVVHYSLQVPDDAGGPIELRVRLRYRKIDYEYAGYVTIQDHPEFRALVRQAESFPQLPHRQAAVVARIVEKLRDQIPRLPIVDLCEDRIVLGLSDRELAVPRQESPIEPAWQRWNDYGIGCYLEGGAGSKRGELRQAEEAFQRLTALDDPEPRVHGYFNLARVYLDLGRLSEAAEVLGRARALKPQSWWTLAWLSGAVNVQNGHLAEATDNYEQILDPRNQPSDRKFDFTRDYSIINDLAATYYKRSQRANDPAIQEPLLIKAVERYSQTLALDFENLDAHYGLSQCFVRLAGSALEAPPAEGEDRTIEAAALFDLAQRFTDGGAPIKERIDGGVRLARDIARYASQPADPRRPKLHTWFDLIAAVRPVFDASPQLLANGDSRTDLRRTAAGLLGLLHRHVHEGLRPDENARDRVVRTYRRTHSHADRAAEPIVIYTLSLGNAPAPGGTARSSERN
ncbi:MAG: hypothetical protein DCC68_18380 [Planctomycetota bacterium]|nr:MAG: hypothetical protein DCC68_18380 [Planctomycetota bacterium]